jgi:diguanylate cyclase (GGDEF)-like protein
LGRPSLEATVNLHTWPRIPGRQPTSGAREHTARTPGLAAAALVCTAVVTLAVLAGPSGDRDVAIGAVAFFAAIVLGATVSRVRYDAMIEEIGHLATRDPLTGLANRRVLDEALPRELARAGRTGAPVSVIVLDVDHFKEVNDRHGHQAGDAVLRRVGAALESNTKGYDVAVRLGGDEFAILLPGCHACDAPAVAERLRERAADVVQGDPVTLSAGYATLTREMADGNELVAAADAGLYAAKRAGRARASSVQHRPATPVIDDRRSA